MATKVERTKSLIRDVCAAKVEHDNYTDVENQLEEIKANGRDTEVSRAITIDDLNLLVAAYVQRKTSHRALMETFTIIANALVINPTLLDLFDPHTISSRTLNECFQLNLDPKENYLLMRMLFLLTFKGIPYEDKSLKTCLTIIAANISRLVGNRCLFNDSMDRLAFIETMKTSFNLLHHYTTQSFQHLNGAVARELVTIYLTLDSNDPLNIDIYQHISNVLLCLPVSIWLYDAENPPKLLYEILKFLETMVNPRNQNTEIWQDRILTPPVSLVHCIVSELIQTEKSDQDGLDEIDEESDLQNNNNVRKHRHHRRHHHHHHPPHPSHPLHHQLQPRWRHQETESNLSDETRNALVEILRDGLLPCAQDRLNKLGEGDSLVNHLLQITIDPMLRTARNIIFDIFWKVSNESPDEFVNNFGLGFASSFLASHGIAFPDSVTTESPSRQQLRKRLDELHEEQPPINPITGQYLHVEKEPPQDEMTEEEKLRDAERLFVLFERLKANNVIKVQNPVEVAARNGELERY